MEETRGTARLAKDAPFDVSTRGVTATLRRSDIEQAVRSGDQPAELLLDVRRGQGPDVVAHSVAVEWSQADLDELLREAESAEEITIAFDRDEMAAAIDSPTDVEAHGLREKALVITVVAVSALSTAGIAQARPAGLVAGGTAATPVTSVVSAPAQAPATTIGGAGVQATSAAGSEVAQSPAMTIGGAGGEATTPSSPAMTIGGAGPAPAEQVATEATSAGGSASTPGAPTQVQVRGEAAMGARVDTGGGASLPSGEAVAALGAAGLAIAAAGFAAAGTRRRPVRPA